MINTINYTRFLIKSGLTQSQLLFLLLIKKKQKKLIKEYKKRFPTDDGTMIGKKWIKDLYDNGWITENNGIIKTTYKFNSLFLDELYNYRELIEVYPKFFTTDKGVKMPLVTGNEHELSRLYGAKLYGDLELHYEILDLVEYGRENNLLNFGIEKFIKSRFWIALKEDKDKNIKKANIDFNDF